MRINDNYLKLKAGYLFPEIGRRVSAFAAANPAAKIIRMGIGDVTEALPAACRTALIKATEEMGERATFKGYGPEQGYAFLREAIATNDFIARGAQISADEIFISDGSKCDCGNILDIFSHENQIAVTDPVYPVYVDTNVMAGNTSEANPQGEYGGITYLRATEANHFMPALPASKVDVIYLCSPSNPTGAVMTREYLKSWVDYANKNGSVILFDAAYEAFITDASIPHSIFEIEGAKTCAIEFRSFSKTAGFTGTRCAFTVVPKELKGKAGDGSEVALHGLWNRRQSTKFNGVSYPIQRAAEAVYSQQGQQEVKALVKFYLENAALIRAGLNQVGLQTFGGVNAPYVWTKCPAGVKSWEMFDRFLSEANIVITPGSGFGAAGEGWFRVSAFNSRANVDEAMGRVAKMKW